MTEFLIIVFVIPAIVYIVLNNTLFPFLKRSKLNRRLSKKGIEAPAILLSIQQTGFFVNNLPQVRLQIQVQPKLGRNFVTEANEILDNSNSMEMYIGGRLTVRYNPGNTREVMVVR